MRSRFLPAVLAAAFALAAAPALAATCTPPGAPPANNVGPIPSPPSEQIPMACHQTSPPASCKTIEATWTAYNNAATARRLRLSDYLRAIKAWGTAAQTATTAYVTCEENAMTVKTR